MDLPDWSYADGREGVPCFKELGRRAKLREEVVLLFILLPFSTWSFASSLFFSTWSFASFSFPPSRLWTSRRPGTW
jgi:hypothetical protein